jgi:hypothetical protein
MLMSSLRRGAALPAPAIKSMLAACLWLALAGHPAMAAADNGWQKVDPARFSIVSSFAPLAGPPMAHADRNKLGGQTISVNFRYEGTAFSLIVYNESPRRLPEPSITAAAERALASFALFKDGDFVLGEAGEAESPLGTFSYQTVHAQRPIGDEELRSCALFQRVLSAGMAALTGFFCDDTTAFDPAAVAHFFATLGIRGIAVPK